MLTVSNTVQRTAVSKTVKWNVMLRLFQTYNYILNSPVPLVCGVAIN
jgi:hypothetical protein